MKLCFSVVILEERRVFSSLLVNKLTVGFCLWSCVLTIGNGIVNLREGQTDAKVVPLALFSLDKFMQKGENSNCKHLTSMS